MAKMSNRRRVAIIGPTLVAASAIGAVLSSDIATASGVSMTVLAAYLALEALVFWGGGGTVPSAQGADSLAVQVSSMAREMAVTSGINSPTPIPIPWRTADDDLFEDWSGISAMAAGWPGASRAGWAAAPWQPPGAGTELIQVLEKVPTVRLVVLGESGAGKTALLWFLVQSLLQRRKAGIQLAGKPCPVPVLVPLASWDPADEKGLRSWLLARMAIDYPMLASPAPSLEGHTLGQELLADGSILPILDGFDEIPEGNRAKAIERINNEILQPGDQLVLSSRTAEYREAIRASPKKLTGTAGIELGTLRVADVREYIRRDISSHPDQASRWHPVFAALDDPAEAVTQAFQTPLMVRMACDIYNLRADLPGPPPDPAVLCRYRRRGQVEEHLLGAFIPAAYRHNAEHPCPWSPEQAENYLSYLAYHLEYQLNGAKDLAWWQLARRSPAPAGRLRWSRAALRAKWPLLVMFALVNGTAFGVLLGGLFGALSGLAFALLIGVTCGVVAAVAVTLVGVPVDVTKASSPDDVLSGDRGVFLRWLVTAPLTGLLLGLIIRLIYRPDAYLVIAPTVGWLLPAPVIGLIIALLLKPGSGVWHRARIGLLATSAVWLAGYLVNTPMSALIDAAQRGLTGHDRPGLTAGILVGLVAGLTMGLFLGYSHSAWGAYTLARCRMALRKSRYRAPWQLMPFLRDAHQHREVLRQAGAYYQFRHRRLQQHLARRLA
jgi:GTPase SAR1 family protein